MILSIDIGIHNLALCIMSSENIKDFKTYKIHLLEVYDILEDTDHHCKSIQKNKKICNKKCGFKFKENEIWIYTCKLHAPKEPNKMKEPKLIEYKRKTIDKYLLQDLITIMINKINEIYQEHIELFDKLQKIHIELQPSKNPKAKMLSHIIYGKLIDLYIKKDFEPPEIKFIPAKQKLKVHYTGPELICKLKSEYSKRKWMSIEICKWYLITQFNDQQKKLWLSKLLDGKSDDKADVFCYAINGITKRPKTKKIKK